jgi:hypothetical protein
MTEVYAERKDAVSEVHRHHYRRRHRNPVC